MIEPLSVSQVNGFLASVSHYRDIAIVLLMLLCGLRSLEVRNLGLADIGFTEKMLRVRGKGNRERALPMPELVANSIRKYLHLERPPESPSDRLFLVLRGKRRGQPMTASGLRSLFRVRRRIQPELGPANPHRFRHTFGADMARAGVRLPVLQRMMGHSSGMTTLRYIQLSVTDIAQEYGRAMERIGERYGSRFPS
jgi:integrase